jgi:osmotically-inducible protein OsmY
MAKRDEQLRVANLDVDADADKKEVTISGTVPSQDLRNRAVDLAKNAQPELSVNDKIEVKRAA